MVNKMGASYYPLKESRNDSLHDIRGTEKKVTFSQNLISINNSLSFKPKSDMIPSGT